MISLRLQDLCKKRLNEKELIQYETYRYSKTEYALAVVKCLAVLLFFSYFFYRSLRALPFLLPGFWFLWKEQKKRKAEKRKKQLAVQFKDCIRCVITNLRAGYSVENAFLEARTEICQLYGERSYMFREMLQISYGLQNHISLEKMLLDLGERSGISDIREFGEIFAIAKRNGGNMTEIISRTASFIEEKMEIDSEIQTLISGKKMEQSVMNLIPFGILFYVELSSPGFFQVLYHNPLGVGIMSGCLLVYLAAYRLSEKIVRIEVG